MRKSRTVFGFFLTIQFFSLSLFATQLAPWFGNVYEFEPTVSYLHFHSRKIDMDEKTRHHRLWGNIETFSLMFTPMPEVSTEFEISGFNSREHEFGLEKTKGTARYLFLNDVAGDIVSVSSGISTSFIPRRSFHDISLMHHGYYETEIHGAIGKEFGFLGISNFFSRAYFVSLLGVAERGCPWVREEAHFEELFQDICSLDLFCKAERGFGKHQIHHIHHFKGYGEIHYRTIDLGLGLNYNIDDFGLLYAKGLYRVNAKNAPKELYAFEVGLDVPFSF